MGGSRRPLEFLCLQNDGAAVGRLNEETHPKVSSWAQRARGTEFLSGPRVRGCCRVCALSPRCPPQRRGRGCDWGQPGFIPKGDAGSFPALLRVTSDEQNSSRTRPGRSRPEAACRHLLPAAPARGLRAPPQPCAPPSAPAAGPWEITAFFLPPSSLPKV